MTLLQPLKGSMVNRDLGRLYHMLDCAKTILKFAERKQRQDLDTDRYFGSAIIREFEVLGEAASAISSETRVRFPHIPWKAVIGMRNQLIHAYFDIDHDIVWKTIQTALPDLIPKIEEAINIVTKCR
jgi:uncharacterized protein with HEPN domain